MAARKACANLVDRIAVIGVPAQMRGGGGNGGGQCRVIGVTGGKCVCQMRLAAPDWAAASDAVTGPRRQSAQSRRALRQRRGRQARPDSGPTSASSARIRSSGRGRRHAAPAGRDPPAPAPAGGGHQRRQRGKPPAAPGVSAPSTQSCIARAIARPRRSRRAQGHPQKRRSFIVAIGQPRIPHRGACPPALMMMPASTTPSPTTRPSGRQRVDVRRDAQLDLRPDQQGQRRRPRPGGEGGDHHIIQTRW